MTLRVRVLVDFIFFFAKHPKIYGKAPRELTYIYFNSYMILHISICSYRSTAGRGARIKLSVLVASRQKTRRQMIILNLSAYDLRWLT